MVESRTGGLAQSIRRRLLSRNSSLDDDVDALFLRLVEESLEAGTTDDLLAVLLDEGTISRTVRHRLFDETQVDDATQIAMLAVHSKLSNFNGTGPFRKWVAAIARNAAHTVQRSESRHSSKAERRVDDPQKPELQQSAWVRGMSSLVVDKNLVEQAIRALPLAQQNAIRLREYGGLSYRQIAEELGCPENTAKTLVKRARDAVGAWLRSAISN